MTKRISVLGTLGLVSVLGMTAAFSAMPGDDVKAKIGEEAPAFTLKGTDDKEHSLSDYDGQVVVLEWINPGCPVCRRCMSDGTVSSMYEEFKDLDEDIVLLAINSTADSTLKVSKDYLEKNNIKIIALDDSAGKVGKLYGAKTTPHLFVIDAEGVLRYAGAIDNGGPGKKGDANYAVNAVKQILDGETVAPSETKAYGCPVKYAN